MIKNNLNIVEELKIEKECIALAKELCLKILAKDNLSSREIVIAIGGESGSGKSSTALSLQNELSEKGLRCLTLHMDSYFKLPPKDNHKNRMLSLENVGPQEVNMSNINEHISSFRKGVKSIQVPIVNYKKSSFTRHELKLTNVDVLIVEGVYSFLLENLDYKIFLKRTYVDSLNVRANRTREKYDPFVELVLAIEHDIVEPMIHEADFIVDKNNTIL